MAKIKAGDGYSVNMQSFDMGLAVAGKPVVTKSSLYSLSFGDGDKLVFRGAGFRYDRNDDPVRGDVKSITLVDGGDAAVTLSGFLVSAKTMLRIAETASDKDDLALLSQIFGKNDSLTGHRLDDKLSGFAGRDLIYGAGGADSLRGGADADTFIYKAGSDSALQTRDKIVDFNQRDGDRIDLSAFGDISFVGQNPAFSGDGTEVGFVKSGKRTTVVADTDGDGVADLSILVLGRHQRAADDFVL